MQNKFSAFLEVASALNSHCIIPILYGSLGVSRLIKITDVDDIDIIVPNKYLNGNFSDLKKIMAKMGYKQDIDYAHEFIKKGKRIGFESRGNLKKDIGIQPKNVKITEIGSVKFGELSAENYITVYEEYLKRKNKQILKMKFKIRELKKLRKNVSKRNQLGWNC